MTAIALAERRWDQAEATLSQALVALEGVDAPLAAWRVYATAAQLHRQRGRRGQSAHYWARSAAILHSVQRDSRFGHPHPIVLGHYQALGTQIFRTDELGAITVRTAGQSVWVEPYVGRPVVLSAPATHRLAKTLPPSAARPE